MTRSVYTFGMLPVGATFYYLGHAALKLAHGEGNQPGKFKWLFESEHPGWNIYNGDAVAPANLPAEEDKARQS
ncbi:hypothetical protein [Leptolyngbya sp. FACHB-261]|uniref:hypothetical protein n=1 Tax=Leptolyngbya sp. FACHB-261 TaxID=2692806 RepID=UPI001685D04F|nr:hypothetical protein [Leptolyngbya sp. FACHB-261]MBD2099782.1 hypothetical protein [Leptolyngbya sp. FACHB-261]